MEPIASAGIFYRWIQDHSGKANDGVLPLSCKGTYVHSAECSMQSQEHSTEGTNVICKYNARVDAYAVWAGADPRGRRRDIQNLSK